MRSLAETLSNLPLPGLAATEPKASARWPVWSNSTNKEIPWRRIPKDQIRKLKSRARL